MPRPWPPETAAGALALVAAGLPHREVSDRTGIPVATIRNWLYPGPPGKTKAPCCDTCGGSPHDFAILPAIEYAYLLGVYLGDGCVSRTPNHCSLRVFLDHKYPGIVAEVRRAIAAVRGRLPWVGTREETCDVVVSYWREWPCWFPQHGPGKKHHRRIALEPWQQEIVEREPGRFLRGLIHSDGWRGLNRVTVKGHSYAYPRYQFSNRSDDIRRLFTDACDQLGIAWRPWTRFHISVARADAVARLDEFVGPKT
jgi:hypothetical protein